MRDEESTCPCGADVEAGAKAFEVLDSYTVLHTAGLCSRTYAEIEIQRFHQWDAENGEFYLGRVGR